MPARYQEQILKEIESVLEDFKRFKVGEDGEYYLPNDGNFLIVAVTRALALISRAAGDDSEYRKEANRYMDMAWRLHSKAPYIHGIVRAMRADVEAGYVRTLSSLVSGEVFSDYLEMAAYLVEEGYKDPAAVISGSTLEAHLRLLCKKNGLDIEDIVDGKVVPRKADRLNSELAKAGVYAVLDQKVVTACLDLRNKAAHGKYGEYTAEQVKIGINQTREFVSRVS